MQVSKSPKSTLSNPIPFYDADGRLNLVWLEHRSRLIAELRHSMYEGGWAEPVRLPTTHSKYRLALDESGRPFIVTAQSLRVSVLLTHEGEWSRSAEIALDEEFSPRGAWVVDDPSTAIDEGGIVHIFVHRRFGRDGSAPLARYLTLGPPYGSANWSELVTVDLSAISGQIINDVSFVDNPGGPPLVVLATSNGGFVYRPGSDEGLESWLPELVDRNVIGLFELKSNPPELSVHHGDVRDAVETRGFESLRVRLNDNGEWDVVSSNPVGTRGWIAAIPATYGTPPSIIRTNPDAEPDSIEEISVGSPSSVAPLPTEFLDVVRLELAATISDSENRAAICWRSLLERSYGGPSAVVCAERHEAGDWRNLGPLPAIGQDSRAPSLDVDDQGNVYIAWVDGINKEVYVAEIRDGVAARPVGLGQGWMPIVRVLTDVPHVLFHSKPGARFKTVDYYKTGGEWVSSVLPNHGAEGLSPVVRTMPADVYGNELCVAIELGRSSLIYENAEVEYQLYWVTSRQVV